jgi:hypothetical protein
MDPVGDQSQAMTVEPAKIDQHRATDVTTAYFVGLDMTRRSADLSTSIGDQPGRGFAY